MQDNHSKYDGNIDEQFADHAWSEMAKLLDKEMPVVAPVPPASNKRKYLLLLLLLLWIGTGTGWWMSTKYYQQQAKLNTNNKEIGLAKEKQHPIKQKAQKAESESKQTHSFDKKNPEITKTQASNKQQQIDEENSFIEHKNNTFQTSTPSSTSSVKPRTLHEKMFKGTIVQTKDINKKDNRLNLETISGLDGLEVNSQQNKLESTNNQSFNAINANEISPSFKKQKETNATPTNIIPLKEQPTDALIRPVAMLDILNIDEIENEKPNEEDLNKYKIIRPKKPFWKPNTIGIELGLHSKELGSVDGFFITGILEYKLKSSRFSFQTGLGYEMIKTQGRDVSNLFNQRDAGIIEVDSSGGNTEYDVDDIVDVITTNSNTFDPNSNSEMEQILIYESYSKLHYLNLPLQLNYRPLSVLELNVGLKMSYLLGTTLTKINQNLTQNFLDLSNTSGFKSLYADENRNLRKVDIKTSFGATWYPKPAIGLSLKYNIGLTRVFPHLTPEKWSDYRNNSWQLSVLFRF